MDNPIAPNAWRLASREAATRKRTAQCASRFVICGFVYKGQGLGVLTYVNPQAHSRKGLGNHGYRRVNPHALSVISVSLARRQEGRRVGGLQIDALDPLRPADDLAGRDQDALDVALRLAEMALQLADAIGQ